MKVGETITFRVLRQTAAGAASTGQLEADFTFSYSVNGSTVTFDPSTVTEGATVGPSGNQWREYFITGVLSSTQGIHHLVVLPDNTDLIGNSVPIFADLGAYDIDDVAALAVAATVTLTSTGGPLGDLSIRVPKNDYAVITFSVRDQAGNLVNLTGDNNPSFDVENQASNLSPAYNQTTGITLGNGTVTLVIPETASFYSQLTAGLNETELYWSLKADLNSVAAQTRTIARGRLTILRREDV